jgi:hypothetical protein
LIDGRLILFGRLAALVSLGLLALALWAGWLVGTARAQAPVIKTYGETITLKPNGDAEFLEVWTVTLAPGASTRLSRPLPLSDPTAVSDVSVVSASLKPIEYQVTPQQGHLVLQWFAQPEPQQPDTTFLVSYTIHGAVQARGQDYQFTWVTFMGDFPYAIASAVVEVELPYAFPAGALQYHVSIGGAVLDSTCSGLPGTRSVSGRGACIIDDHTIAYSGGAFSGQPWEISLRYPQAVPAPTATTVIPSPTPRLQLASAATPAPFVYSLLALLFSAILVGLLWAWARPTPALPFHEMIVISLVAVGATLAAGLLGVVWLAAGSFYWTLDLVFAAALLITALIVLPYAVWQGRAYDRDRQQMLAGQNLAHWTYTAEEHREFITSEVERLRRSTWIFLAGSAILTVVFAIVGAAIGLGLALGAVFLAAGLLATASVAVPLARLQASLAGGQDLGPGELFISAKGALLFGRYMPLQGFNLWVESVNLLEGEPPRLKFRTVSQGNRGSRVVNDVYVPVPADRQAEGEALAASYPISKP